MVHAILGAGGPMGKDLHRNWPPQHPSRNGGLQEPSSVSNRMSKSKG
jgi:hypothetical protein